MNATSARKLADRYAGWPALTHEQRKFLVHTYQWIKSNASVGNSSAAFTASEIPRGWRDEWLTRLQADGYRVEFDEDDKAIWRVWW